jgi:hypothetical protein
VDDIIQIGTGTHYLTRTRHEPGALCRRCHVLMHDCEDRAPKGEYYHPSYRRVVKGNGSVRYVDHPCPNRGKCLKWEGGELVPWKRKRDRRALKRGAKWASKHRPK